MALPQAPIVGHIAGFVTDIVYNKVYASAVRLVQRSTGRAGHRPSLEQAYLACLQAFGSELRSEATLSWLPAALDEYRHRHGTAHCGFSRLAEEAAAACVPEEFLRDMRAPEKDRIFYEMVRAAFAGINGAFAADEQLLGALMAAASPAAHESITVRLAQGARNTIGLLRQRLLTRFAVPGGSEAEALAEALAAAERLRERGRRWRQRARDAETQVAELEEQLGSAQARAERHKRRLAACRAELADLQERPAAAEFAAAAVAGLAEAAVPPAGAFVPPPPPPDAEPPRGKRGHAGRAVHEDREDREDRPENGGSDGRDKNAAPAERHARGGRGRASVSYFSDDPLVLQGQPAAAAAAAPEPARGAPAGRGGSIWDDD